MEAPARTNRQFCFTAVVALNVANAWIASATFFFRSKRFNDKKVGRSLAWSFELANQQSDGAGVILTSG